MSTELGGAFYLLTIALARGLYGDFTQPAAPGIPLSPWDFLALVGRALLAPDPSPDEADDPLWPLLGRLAGRTADQPAPRAPRAMRRWAAGLAGRLRPELAVVLGCRPDQAGGKLIRSAARIEVTGTEVAVRFSLTDLPIEIRMAGLDRDPGWIPATGRTVTFHFD